MRAIVDSIAIGLLAAETGAGLLLMLWGWLPASVVPVKRSVAYAVIERIWSESWTDLFRALGLTALLISTGAVFTMASLYGGQVPGPNDQWKGYLALLPMGLYGVLGTVIFLHRIRKDWLLSTRADFRACGWPDEGRSLGRPDSSNVKRSPVRATADFRDERRLEGSGPHEGEKSSVGRAAASLFTDDGGWAGMNKAQRMLVAVVCVTLAGAFAWYNMVYRSGQYLVPERFLYGIVVPLVLCAGAAFVLLGKAGSRTKH